MNQKEVENVVEEFFHGQYRIEKFLGEGAFADVYLVKHRFLNDRRAMKINKESLPSKDTDKIFKEARIATLIRHKNVISIHDAGIISVSSKDKNGEYTFGLIDEEEKHYAYFVMEYIVGGDLGEYWHSFKSQGKVMPIIEVLDIMKQICSGLSVLHNNKPKILHRDIKPQNILIKMEYGRPLIKITDFGLADAKDSDKSFSELSIAGTPVYMAPECFKEKYSTMSDIYALGVIFYLILTNKYPYELNKFSKIQIASGQPWKRELEPPSKINPEISPKLDDIIMNCLKVNPKDRYKDSNELLKVINDYMDYDLGVDENTVIYSSENSLSCSFDEENEEDNYGSNLTVYMENLVSEAFELAKQEGRLEEAIEILEKAIINNMDVREKYTYRLRLWKDEMPGEKLKVESFKIYCLNIPNYPLACELLEEAIAYDSKLNEKYEGYIKLWRLLYELNLNKNLKEAIESLKDLMEEYMCLKDIYNSIIEILETSDVNKIVEESFKIIKKDKWDDFNIIRASRLMEFAVLSDDDIKTKYYVKLSLWKRGLSM